MGYRVIIWGELINMVTTEEELCAREPLGGSRQTDLYTTLPSSDVTEEELLERRPLKGLRQADLDNAL